MRSDDIALWHSEPSGPARGGHDQVFQPSEVLANPLSKTFRQVTSELWSGSGTDRGPAMDVVGKGAAVLWGMSFGAVGEFIDLPNNLLTAGEALGSMQPDPEKKGYKGLETAVVSTAIIAGPALLVDECSPRWYDPRRR